MGGGVVHVLSLWGSTAWLLQCPYSEEELEREGIEVATGPDVQQPKEVLQRLRLTSVLHG